MPIKILSGSEFPKNVIPLIDKATKTIDVVVFDWRWYPQEPGESCQLFNQSLVRAIRRGVKIRAIANSKQIIEPLIKVGANAKKLLTKRLVHCKLMIIDENIAITGSHNYSKSAFNSNLELSVIIKDDPEIVSFIKFFNNIWSK